MKNLRLLGACALAAAGVASSALGQVQGTGNLQVSLDATALPAGPLAYVTNSGLMGGVFQSSSNSAFSVGAQVVPLGGGTHAFIFGGNECLLHLTGPDGSPFMVPPTLSGSTPTFSVEAWVFEETIPNDNPIVSWGTRGNCNPNQVSCAYGANSSYGGFAMWCNDKGWAALPAAAAWHHLVWTLNGTNLVLYSDGATNATYVINPAIDPNNNIGIAFTHGSTGGTTDGLFGAAAIGRVRVWDGVLTGAQVLNNYRTEVGAFTYGAPAYLAAKPLHRWSFNNPATSEASGLTVADKGTAYGTASQADAVVKGTTNGAAQFTGSQLTLGGGGSGTAPYVDLPNGLISSQSADKGGTGQLTLELWATPTGNRNWPRLFDFGSNTVGEVTAPGGNFNGVNYFTLAVTPGTDLNHSAIGFPGTMGGNLTFASRITGSQVHMVVTWDDATGKIAVYENAIQVASFITTNKLATINDVNDWLGRSNWSGDDNFQGSFAEFRLFNRILSVNEILNDYQVGPTVVDPVLKWNGNLSGNWDINSSANWLLGSTPVNYADGSVTKFDDTLAGTANVVLTTAVRPSLVAVNNTLTNYTFSGSGSIAGSVGLTKSGNGTLFLANDLANSYTGPTTIQGGTLVVSNLVNGGTPSPIGAASSAAANLVLAGGTLSYRGPAASVNRGYTVSGNSKLDLQNDLTLSGPIAAVGGTFTKSGAGTLALTGAGNNTLSAGGGGQAFGVGSGLVVLDGSAGQTNRITGETWVGFNQTSGASLILTNTTLTNSSWFAVGRGNGTAGFVSTATLYNSTWAMNNISLGYANGIAGNNQTVSLSLNGNSRIYNTGGTGFNLSESPGSTSTVNINDNSFISSTRLLMGMSGNATGILNISGNGAITNTGWVSLGAPGNATATLKDNAIWQALVDFNVTDTAGSATTPSVGTLNIQDNALLRISTLYMGKSAYCTGTINQSGGTVVNSGGGDWRIGGNNSGAASQVGIWNFSGGTLTCDRNFQVGAYGTGSFNQTGGTATFPGGWLSIGRFSGGVGYLNVSGGTFSQAGSGNALMFGEDGTGTCNVSGTGVLNANRITFGVNATGVGTLNLTNGVVNATNNLVLGNNASASATLNLVGGTLATRRILMNAGSSTFNFYGGTLKAMPGASPAFMGGLSSANIFGNATIDTDTNAITISQDLYDGGTGGSLTKVGTGSLTLSPILYYTGPTTVSAGKLGLTAGGYIAGSGVTVATGAGLGVQCPFANSQVTLANLTLGGANSLDFNLGDVSGYGNPSMAPLSVSSTLTTSGAITINVAASGLVLGEFPLIYFGTRGGAGSFALGTLPLGVTANLVTNTTTSTIDLNITSINQPRWNGLPGADWDIGVSGNWINMGTSLSTFYTEGSAVLFDDLAQGSTTVNLTTTVNPARVTVNNNTLPYTFSGSGKINGSAGLTKQGTGSLTIANTAANSYTGPTVIAGGTLNVATLANGGSPSAIGSSSASATNLVFAGGTLNYTGPAVAINRGYLLTDTNSSLVIANDLALSGQATANTLTSAGFVKDGPARLAYTGVGNNTLATANSPGYIVQNGTVVFDGSAGGQTNLIQGSRLGVDGVDANATVILTNTTVNLGGNLDLGNVPSTTGTLVMNNGATLNIGSWLIMGDGQNSVGTATLNGGTVNVPSGGHLLMGGAGNTTTTLNVFGGALNVSGPNFDIADAGWNQTAGRTGTVNQTNGVVTCAGEIWVGQYTDALGYYNLSGGTLNQSNWFVIGRNGAYGKMTMTGGTLNKGGNGNLIIGSNGGGATSTVGIFEQSGGTINCSSEYWTAENNGCVSTNNISGTAVINESSYVTIGRNGLGVVNMSGGRFNHTGGNPFIIGIYDTGNGTWNQSGGVLTSENQIWISQGQNSATAATQGALNLSGTGAITNNSWLAVGRENGTGFLNISGGSLTTAINSGANVSIAHGGAPGTVNMTGGVFTVVNGQTWIGEDSNTGTWNMNGGTALLNYVQLARNSSATGVLNLNNGTMTASEIAGGSGPSTLNFNGGTLVAGAGASAGFLHGLTAANVLGGGAILDSGANVVNVNQALLGDGNAGGLTKLGNGTLNLNGVNTYTGATLVNAGTLGGSGVIAGPVTVAPTAALAPGNASLGKLTVNNTVSLGGSTVVRVTRNGGVAASDQLAVSGNLAFNGALNVVFTGTNALAVGDTFQLFTWGTQSGSFSTLNLPAGYGWDTSKLTVDGTIRVTAVVAPKVFPPLVSGGNLVLTGTGFVPGASYYWLTSTNVAAPLTTWTTNSTGLFDANGAFSNALPINVSQPAQFFKLQVP